MFASIEFAFDFAKGLGIFFICPSKLLQCKVAKLLYLLLLYDYTTLQWVHYNCGTEVHFVASAHRDLSHHSIRFQANVFDR